MLINLCLLQQHFHFCCVCKYQHYDYSPANCTTVLFSSYVVKSRRCTNVWHERLSYRCITALPFFIGSVGRLHGCPPTKREADEWKYSAVESRLSPSSKIAETDLYVLHFQASGKLLYLFDAQFIRYNRTFENLIHLSKNLFVLNEMYNWKTKNSKFLSISWFV